MSRAGSVQTDVLLIGTGLPMLFEGLSHAESGRQVTFIDRASTLGGSWSTGQLLGFDGVELGVHIIENRRALNRAFLALMGADQLAIGGRDFGMAGTKRLNMRLTRVALYMLVGVKAALSGNAEKARHSAWQAKSAIAGLSTPFMYPKDGFSTVLNVLEQRLADCGARFVMNCDARVADVTNEAVHVDTADRRISAGQLIMSSRAHVAIRGFEPLWLDVQKTCYDGLTFRLTGARPQFDGYVEFLGDPLIKRVRHLSARAMTEMARGDHLLAVQLRSGVLAGAPRAEAAHATMARLRESRLLGPDSHLVDFVETVRSVETLPARHLRQIARAFPQRVRVMQTVDLSDQPLPVPKARPNTEWSGDVHLVQSASK